MMQRLAVLGSTGSIGKQTLDIIRDNPELYELRVLVANNSWQELVEQAIEFEVDSVVIAQESLYKNCVEALKDYPVKVYTGSDAIEDVVTWGEVDVVINAMVGYSGLRPTVAAIRAGKKIALANKETLVVAGEEIMRLAIEHKTPILPIDSEHSAIFQCLSGESSPVKRLILTCSGGSFRNYTYEQLSSVSVEEALRHPQWSMGAKITIDSATLVNKGFEVIEAHWLFGMPAEKIDVIIHPQAVIHSMVEFEDGAIKAQLGTPDMHIPIAYALSYPHRLNKSYERFDFLSNPTLSFEAVDEKKYPALGLSYEVLRRGGSAACTMNGANEVAVAKFLNGECGYLDIVASIEYALSKCGFITHPTLDDYAQVDIESRALANEYLKNI
ncbi:MAG: 1-deoxy-D-xylulose-5-phosphate reductoisomerase [Rikenellaceae bacterium]